MGVYRVPIELAWVGPGSPGVNVFHVRTVAEPPAGDLQQMVDLLHAFYTALAQYYPGGTTINLGDVVEVTDSTFASAAFVEIVGSGPATAAAPVLQMCVSWRTSLAARRGIGRTFIGPLTAAVVEANGSIAPTVLDDLRTRAADLVTGSEAFADGAIAIWGLDQPNPLPGTPSAPLPHVARDITGSRVRDQFAVLRSRRD